MTSSLPTPIDYGELRRAIDALGDALAQPMTAFTRDDAIQRFGYAFEVSSKTLRRYLAEETGTDGYNILDLFRAAGRQGLIHSVEDWSGYLKACAVTAGAYRERAAEETCRLARAFLPAATALLGELERRSGARR